MASATSSGRGWATAAPESARCARSVRRNPCPGCPCRLPVLRCVVGRSCDAWERGRSGRVAHRWDLRCPPPTALFQPVRVGAEGGPTRAQTRSASLASIVAGPVRTDHGGAHGGAAQTRRGAAASRRWRSLRLGIAQARWSEPVRRRGTGRHERAAGPSGGPADGQLPPRTRIRAPSRAAGGFGGRRPPRRALHGRGPGGVRRRPLGSGRTRGGGDRGRRAGGGAHDVHEARGVRHPSGADPGRHPVPPGTLAGQRPKSFTQRDPDAADLASRRPL